MRLPLVLVALLARPDLPDPAAEIAAVRAELAAVDAAIAAGPPGDDADFARRCWAVFAAADRRLAALPLTDAVRDDGWLRLRRVEAGLYPVLNRIAANALIPLTFDNGHHRSAQRWVRLAAAGRTLGDAVLHVDSHPDARGLPEADALPRIRAALARDATDAAALARLEAVVWDINHPLATATGLGARTLIWVKPPWAVLSGEHRLALRFGPAPAGPGTQDCPAGGLCFAIDRRATGEAALRRFLAGLPEAERASMVVAEAPGDGVPVVLSVLADERPDLAASVAAAMPGQTFLLSLDLDVFTTGGQPGHPGSPCSSGRISRACAGQPSDPTARQAAFEAERRAIDGRLARFARLMAGLAAAGKRPAVVSVADSTWLQGSRCPACDATDDFTPPDFVAYVRHRALAAVWTAWPQVGAEWRPEAGTRGSPTDRPTTAGRPSGATPPAGAAPDSPGSSP